MLDECSAAHVYRTPYAASEWTIIGLVNWIHRA